MQLAQRLEQLALPAAPQAGASFASYKQQHAAGRRHQAGRQAGRHQAGRQAASKPPAHRRHQLMQAGRKQQAEKQAYRRRQLLQAGRKRQAEKQAHRRRQLVVVLAEQLVHLLVVPQDGTQRHRSVAPPVLKTLRACAGEAGRRGRAETRGRRRQLRRQPAGAIQPEGSYPQPRTVDAPAFGLPCFPP